MGFFPSDGFDRNEALGLQLAASPVISCRLRPSSLIYESS